MQGLVLDAYGNWVLPASSTPTRVASCKDCKQPSLTKTCWRCKEAKNERGTLPETLELCKKLANVPEYTLDVAASDELHVCPAYYTKGMDALSMSWYGHVWCNPPFDRIPEFVGKAWAEYVHCDSISMLIPANRTEQPFWQELVERQRDYSGSRLDTHFLPGRTRFLDPATGKPFEGSPPFACVLLVWR